MNELLLAAQERENAGKGFSRKMRVAGTIPAVLYGLKEEPQKLQIVNSELLKLLRQSSGENILIDLKVGKNNPTKVLLKEVQRHPVRDDILHADFLRLDLKKKINIEVPVRIIGTAEGVKAGGILEFVKRELEVSCLPTHIPDAVDIDVTDLNIGDSIHVSDLDVKEFEIITEEIRTIVVVQPPVVAKVEEVEEGEEVEGEEGVEAEGTDEPTEPEVITEKKKDEEK